MSKIKRLKSDVIGQIAAGEVVERPAAAIKELVENSLDAGATGVTVEIENGGLSRMIVTDNGCGMAAEDLALAFERHATSKLETADQLSQIETLGFRGEALSSIAAVSRVKLLTRRENDGVGVSAENEGGVIQKIEDAACAKGTRITVRDLFFNAPVRLKFMKKPSQEGMQIADLMRLLILSHPEVSFRFRADGRQVYFSAGDGRTESAVLSVYGLASLRQMKPVQHTELGVTVSGYVGVGDLSRGNRVHQSFFVNGRAMRSPLLSAAVEEACRQRVMIGRFPMCVLYIALPYHLVDVNVHPNKWEVRFSNENDVREAVIHAVQDALSEGAATAQPPSLFIPPSAPPGPVITVSDGSARTAGTQPAAPPPRPAFLQVRDGEAEKAEEGFWEAAPQAEGRVEQSAPEQPVQTAPPVPGGGAEQPEAPVQTAFYAPPEQAVRLIGVAFDTYILFEWGDQLMLCDQHALHERLLFEQLQKAHEQGAISQLLLMPLAVRLGYHGYHTFLTYQALLAQAGYDAEDFGEQTVRLHAVPLILDVPKAESGFEEALDILEASGRLSDTEKFDRLLQSACKHAVKGGEKLPMAALKSLIEDMMKRDVIPTCPHGRPLMVSLTRTELDRRFGRIQP